MGESAVLDGRNYILEGLAKRTPLGSNIVKILIKLVQTNIITFKKYLLFSFNA